MKLDLDLSHKDHGYFLARAAKTDKKLRLKVEHGKDSLYYMLNGEGTYETFPLQLGNGKYKISLYVNTRGSKYAFVWGTKTVVDIEDEKAVYLHHNQYVPECSKAPKNLKTVAQITNYIETNFAYDFIKAVRPKPITEALPDVNGCFINKMGVCQDLAALTASMLRSADIPAKLVIGYADKLYHAWVMVDIKGEWQLYDPTLEIGAMTKPKKYVVERWY